MVDIETAIVNNLQLITKTIVEKNGKKLPSVSTIKIKKRLKEVLGKRVFRIHKQEILYKLNQRRKKVYNDHYYSIRKELRVAEAKTEDRWAEHAKTRRKARIAHRELLKRKNWSCLAVLTFKNPPRSQMGAYFGGYYLKKFLTEEAKCVNDIYFNIEHKNAYHLNLFCIPRPGVSAEELRLSISNYWNKYQGLCWIDAVKPEKDYVKYFTKDTFSELKKLSENYYDLAFDIKYSEMEQGLGCAYDDLVEKQSFEEKIQSALVECSKGEPMPVVRSYMYAPSFVYNSIIMPLAAVCTPPIFGIIIFIFLMLMV